MCSCECCQQPASRRRFRPFALLFQLLLVYLILVAGGGTLINTGHPVAVEVGRIMQLVTFVEPTIAWIDARGFEPLVGGLRLLAGGLPVGASM